MNLPNGTTYEQQLAERAAELLPGIGLEDRLELLGVMDPDDMRSSLAWLASHAPQLFDFALVRDRAMVDRLQARLDEDEGAADEKPPGFDCDCGRRLPWPGRMQDETCPDCGAVWEHDGVSIGGGARLKQLGRLPAREPRNSDGRRGLIGRLVEHDYDDSPCPVVGLVVGQVDEDTLEVLWGDQRFEENPGTGTYEAFDTLRPARDGAR